jgi:dATP pyrophosphohydrolase
MAGRVKQSIEAWLYRTEPDGPRVLLLKVAAEPGEHPGFWQPITGGIKSGETPEQACVREIREETGLRVAPEALTVAVADFDVPISPELTVHKKVFTAVAPPGAVRIAPDEHEDHRWVRPEQVEESLYWESNRTTWAKVRAHWGVEA